MCPVLVPGVGRPFFINERSTLTLPIKDGVHSSTVFFYLRVIRFEFQRKDLQIVKNHSMFTQMCGQKLDFIFE